MINLNKTTCRGLLVDVLQLQDVPPVRSGLHYTKINKNHAQLNYPRGDYYYTVGIMKTGINEIWFHVSCINEWTGIKPYDYIVTYIFDWETGTAGKKNYDSRER